MTANFRTRVELTCWDIVIPVLTKLRTIRATAEPKHAHPLTGKQYVAQVIIWSAVGLLIGFGLSYIHALHW